MTRLQQARFLAQTDPYWAAYCHGLDDKHRVRDNASVPRRESWDSDWAPTPNETGAPQDGRTGRNGTGSRTAETNPAENAYPKETP